MKAIIHLVKRDASAVRRVGYLANKKTLIGDWIGNDIRFNSEALLFDHHGKGRQTRHVIISLERGADMETERLTEVAERFVSAFAPSSAWLGAIDRNTRATHIHLVISNSDGVRTLNFSPDVLKKMQAVSVWTDGILQDGRCGAVLAKLTTARQLQSMTYEQIQTEIERGNLAVGRCNKRGQITSVVLGGRRVRLSTVQRTAALPDAHGDATHRLPGDSKMGVDGPLAAQRQHRSDATRRRTAGNHLKRAMGAADAHTSREAGTTHATPRREPSELFPACPRPLQGASPSHGTFPMARNPQMGGRSL